MNQIRNLFRGADFYFRGVGSLARHPSLFALSTVPIFLTVLALTALAWGGFRLTGVLLSDIAPQGMGGLLQVIVLLVVLYLALLVYLPVTRVFLAPLSERLSRRTSQLTGSPVLLENEHGIARAILEGLKLVALQIVILVIVFGIGILFPPVGIPLGIIATVCFCGMDFIDVPLSVRGYSFRRKLEVWRRNVPMIVGFSLAAYLLLHIPVVNLIALPVGIIGSTLLVQEVSSE